MPVSWKGNALNDDYTDEADGVDDFDADIHQPPAKQPASKRQWEQPFSIPRAANEFTGALTAMPGNPAGRQRLTSRQAPADSADGSPVHDVPQQVVHHSPIEYDPDGWVGATYEPQGASATDNWTPVPTEPLTQYDYSPDPGRTAPAELRQPKANGVVRRAVYVSVAVVVVALAAGSLWVFLRGNATHDSQTPDSAVAATTSAAASSSGPTSSTPADDCPESTAGGIVRGHGPGDQQSGPGVIMAWNYAYYTDRSGAAAKSVTTPGAVADANVIQQYIDKIPAGTHYCLLIEPDAPTVSNGPNRFRVTLTEIPPAEKGQDLQPVPTVIPQTIDTIQVSGKTWITGIRKRDG